MVYESQKKANEKYRKEKVRQHNLKFYPGEYMLYDFAKSQGNMSGYIKSLIEKDMSSRLHLVDL